MHDGDGIVFPENLVELVAITDVAYLERAPLDKFGVTIERLSYTIDEALVE
jgi:hypothetical protein